MKASVQLIRPVDAEMLLQGNLHNRRISKKVIARYVADMKAGRWRPNGSSISIYDDGSQIILLNGQHRLLALIEAGIEMTFVIVEEDSTDIFSVLDIGKARTTTDVLGMAGYTNVNVRQATVRIVINYDRTKGTKDMWDRFAIPPNVVLEWLENNPEDLMTSAIADFYTARTLLPVVNSWYGGLSYLVRRDSPNKGRWLEFHELFRTGANLGTGHPILSLRSYTINRARMTGKFQQTAWDRQAHVGVGIRAWNDFLVQREARHYKFMKSSLPMPEIH